MLPLLGPAFVAAIAYVDPGNFATNIAGGAKYGYLLIWVVARANLMAMLIQWLSAKVGIATGRNLAELCREHFPRAGRVGLWIQAELIAMATDMAEFVGAAIALNLLFHVPLFPAGLITAVVAFAILGLQARGYRRFEVAIAGLLGIILLGFLYDTLRIGGDAGGLAQGLIPGFAGTDSVLLAAGILGATVMPHVIYLHSALTQDRIPPRDDASARRCCASSASTSSSPWASPAWPTWRCSRSPRRSSTARGRTGVDTIEGAHARLRAAGRGGPALAFALALLASGFASSSVGTYAGQVVMKGFIDRSIPLLVRRGLTMTAGADRARHRARSDADADHLAGHPVLRDPVRARPARLPDLDSGRSWARSSTSGGRPQCAAAVAALIISLNLFLIYETFFG